MKKLSHRSFAIKLTGPALSLILTSILLAAASTMGFARAGQLGPTFANQGVFSDNFNGSTAAASVVTLQSNGEIVAGRQMSKFHPKPG